MKKSFLITGGSGFIGSHAIRSLVDMGYDVYNFDKLTYASNEESLKHISSSSYNFIKGDIANNKDLEKVINLSKPDYILNFAAESHVDRSIESPDAFINTNIIGTYTLLNETLHYYESLSQSKKEKFKLIHISTDEVYGSLDFSEKSSSELSPYKPNSPYSASKASSDLLVRSWFKTYNLPTIITHSTNNYGPWQFPEKLIPLTIANALKGSPIEVYGDGKNIRDWIFVGDNVSAIIELTLNGIVGQEYNIASNNEVSNIEIVRNICKILDNVIPLDNSSYSDLIVFVSDRPGHDKRYSLDTNKILTETNWVPKTSLDKGLKVSIDWMIKNKDWLYKKTKGHKRIGLKKR